MSSEPAPRLSMLRARWAAIGAVLAVCLGAGSIGVANAVKSSGERSTYTAIASCRVTDTRSNPDFNTGPKNTPLGAGATMTVEVTGDNGNCTGIPADITGVSLNVTTLHATDDTHITIWPDGPVPDASSLNPAPGTAPAPNAVTTKVASDGTFRVFNFQGSVNVIIDIVGYHQDHNHDDRYASKQQVDDKAARNQTLFVSPTAFRGQEAGHHVTGSDRVGLIDNAGVIVAPLNLPVGTTLHAVTYYYQDSMPTSSLNLSLGASSADGSTSGGFVNTFSTSGNSSERRTQREELDYVMPDGKTHYLRAGSSDWSEPGGQLWVFGVDVEYTLPS